LFKIGIIMPEIALAAIGSRNISFPDDVTKKIELSIPVNEDKFTPFGGISSSKKCYLHQ